MSVKPVPDGVDAAFGHKWSIATHTKDLPLDEMKQGMDEATAKMPKSA
jgi:hypothetical protein